jgi:hypothetical protein
LGILGSNNRGDYRVFIDRKSVANAKRNVEIFAYCFSVSFSYRSWSFAEG